MSNSFKYSLDLQTRMWKAYFNFIGAHALYWAGIVNYNRDFSVPMLRAYLYFIQQEFVKLNRDGYKNSRLFDYEELTRFSTVLAINAWKASMDQALHYHSKEYSKLISSLMNTFQGAEGEKIDEYTAAVEKGLERLVIDLPEKVREIGKDYGFHFDDGGYEKIAETDRMLLYRVLPTRPGIIARNDMKPVLIAHPYVLGPNIMSFLPGEDRSYVHAFANEGIPTYARIVKDINTNVAVQVMNGEDDALDTRFFAKLLAERHGKPVTLNGVCQGGLILLADVLSGKLEGLVDALITAASPIDGSRSPGLRGYLDGIPSEFRDLSYAVKTLPNGNKVVDGQIMTLVYKLKSIEKEFPLYAFYRDLEAFEEKVRGGTENAGKTGLAVSYWLLYDRVDLPINITKMSEISYSRPISHDGTLPFTLFGKKLNLNYITDHKISYLICYGEDDRLVEPPSALAPTDYINPEVTGFPKGHAAIFTSWSKPDSQFALHKKFRNGQRGPVKFHLDLDEAISPTLPHKKAACW